MFQRALSPLPGSGGELPSSYVFSYNGGDYYLYKDGVQVAKSETLNYQDENIKIEYAGMTHKFTVTALSKIKQTDTNQKGGAQQVITFTEYNPNDVILSSSVNAYVAIPLFLQVLK